MKIIKSGVRETENEFHIECRFEDGQKFAAITIDKLIDNAEDLAQSIVAECTRLHFNGLVEAAQLEGTPLDTVSYQQILIEFLKSHYLDAETLLSFLGISAVNGTNKEIKGVKKYLDNTLSSITGHALFEKDRLEKEN